jgi:3-deoxy-7-phosphoheptulonate synthase
MTKPIESTTWHPATWQSRPALQQPTYLDQHELQTVIASISRLPPLVVSWEVDALKARIAAAQRGECFVLQGGDCAESFDECESDRIASQLKVLLQMSVVLLHGLKKPVLHIGRMAGQYAKPRSADTETRDGVTLPCYRGDNVNRVGFTAADREANPQLLLRGYERAALTLNFVRSLMDGGFADLRHPEYWDLDFLRHSPLRQRYEQIVRSICSSLDFFEAMSNDAARGTERVAFYVSHEALHLSCEQAQTRYIARNNRWYNLSTHLPWIGMRTAALDGAHVEYFRGIANPIGIKVGPSMETGSLQRLLAVLNPNNEPGRITLIHRMGARMIDEHLPRLIEAVHATGNVVLWMCDPMHGNTETTSSGHKTRRFDKIASELDACFRIHESMGSRVGGVHFELTGENVTECTGGARGLTDADLSRAYKSQVDPRLNAEQALELAMRISYPHTARPLAMRRSSSTREQMLPFQP